MARSPLRRATAALGGPAGIVLFALALGFLLSFARHGINWIDEGFALNAAQRIADGEVLYRDFFAPYGPGRHQLLGLLFRALGSHLMVARGLWLALTAAAAVVIYRVATRLMPGGLALTAAAVFVLAPMQAYKVFSPAGYLVVLLLVLRAVEGGGARRWIAAGLGAGLAGLFRFELWGAGGVLLLAGALLPCRGGPGVRRPARLGAAAAGMAAMIVPFALLLLARGSLTQVLRYERMQKEQLARFFTLPLPSPLRAWQGGGDVASRAADLFEAAASWAPAALCLWAAAAALRRLARGDVRRHDPALLLLALAGALMHVAYLGRADFDHLLHVMPVAWLLLFHALHRAWSATGAARRSGRPAAVAGAAFVAAFLATAVVRHPSEGQSVGRLWGNTERLEFDRAVYYDTPYQAAVTREIASFVEAIRPAPEPGGGGIAFLKFGSFWYWLLELPSPIPQDPLSTFSAEPRWADEEEAIIGSLRRAGVEWVLVEEPPEAVAVVPPLRTIHPRLWRFLQREFAPTHRTIGEWSVLRRRP